MKQQIIDLWKESFGDSDEFIQLYFDRVYSDDHTLVIKKNGTVISALQILPYEMTYCGTTIPVGYICGVCTLPSEQRKGFMKQLMFMALEEMRKRNYALAILIPASPRLFDYYRRFDFANAFDYSIEEMSLINPTNHPVSNLHIRLHKELSPDTLYAYYHLKQSVCDCTVQHSAYRFETICLDWMLGKGELWMAFRNELPVGLAFTMITDHETLSIREIMVENAETKNALVQSVLNHHQLPKAILRLPPTLSKSIPYGMARIINKEQMIDLYRTSHIGVQSSRFKVQSPTARRSILATPYNYCYDIFRRSVDATPSSRMFPIQSLNFPDLTNLDLPHLTQILLKYEQRQAFMNMMMD